MRSHLFDFHEGDVDHLSFSGSGASVKKERLYKLAIIGYKKFLGKQDYEWFKPHAAKWSHGSLTVRVNPEIGLIIGGKRHLIKLYLKQEKLSKPRINIILSMMRSTFASKTYEVAVLDVVRGQLYKGSESSVSLSALLEGEAATFMAIWNSIADVEQNTA